MSTTTVAGTTADPTIKYIDLELGGKTYKLAFDFDAIARAEELTGMELLFGVNWSKISVLRANAMLYASALKAQPDLKPDHFKRFIRHGTAAKIQIALAETWVESTPEKDEEPETENPPKPEPELS